MAVHNNLPLIINMGNSIIGVSVLAMPYCFQQCGILLGMLLLLFCTWLTLVSCRLLMKAGIATRRRSYEFLAYHTHGAPGKFLAEIGMIGMQFGTLIAQMVVIGDLGPSIVSKLFGIDNFSNMRTFLIISLGLSIGLPMGLLKDLRTVSKASTVCLICYSVYVFYVIIQSLPLLASGNWFPDVNFWRTKGLFRCLPIFSFSFGCQSQLFILYDALPEPSLKVFSSVTNSAVNFCAAIYLLVGFSGYITYHSQDIPGDLINILPVTPATDATKLAFVISTVITFPVIIYPCRASIYTLFFAKRDEPGVSCPPTYNKQDSEIEEPLSKSKPHEDFLSPNSHMPERVFKFITVGIVLSSMVVSILIPNVELILGFNGAIMGTLICYIFPALFYLKVMGTGSEDKNKAQFLLFAGITILLVSTMATLSPPEKEHGHGYRKDLPVLEPMKGTLPALNPLGDVMIPVTPPANDGIRKEPPNPDPPDKILEILAKPKIDVDVNPLEAADVQKHDKTKTQEESLRVQALEKEKKQDDLIAKLEQHRVEQEKLIEEQKQLIQEFKLHHQQDMKDKEHLDQHQDQQQLANQPQAQPLTNEGIAQPSANQAQPQQPLGNQPQAQPQLNQNNPDNQRLNADDKKDALNPQDGPQINPGKVLPDKMALNPADVAQEQNPNLQAQRQILDSQNQPLAEGKPQAEIEDDVLRLRRDVNQSALDGGINVNQQPASLLPENQSADKSSTKPQKADIDIALPTQGAINLHTEKTNSKNPEMRRKLRSVGH